MCCVMSVACRYAELSSVDGREGDSEGVCAEG